MTPETYEIDPHHTATATPHELKVCGVLLESENPVNECRRLAALFGWTRVS